MFFKNMAKFSVYAVVDPLLKDTEDGLGIMKNFKLILLCCALVCVASVVGCKKSDGLCPVEGMVTLNGQPLEEGYIEMGPMAGQSGTATGGKIVAGAYSIRVSPGEMVVGIRAQKVVQISPEEQTADEKAHGVTERMENLIPDKYNNRSELRCTVSPGKNTVNFDLTTDDAAK